MATATTELELPVVVQEKLREVRSGIRRYVWLEGAAAIAIAAGWGIWMAALSWLLEPPPSVRNCWMPSRAAGVLVVAYRYLLRRVLRVG